MILVLLGLAMFPIFAYRWSKRHYLNHNGLITGVATGIVISPFSLGLYGTFYLPFIGLISGMIGGFLASFHGSPGFKIATLLGLREPRTVVAGIEHIQIEIINAIIWGVVYGLIGKGIDAYRSLRRRRTPSL